jgi:hypothetical protein
MTSVIAFDMPRGLADWLPRRVPESQRKAKLGGAP